MKCRFKCFFFHILSYLFLFPDLKWTCSIMTLFIQNEKVDLFTIVKSFYQMLHLTCFHFYFVSWTNHQSRERQVLWLKNNFQYKNCFCFFLYMNRLLLISIISALVPVSEWMLMQAYSSCSLVVGFSFDFSNKVGISTFHICRCF